MSDKNKVDASKITLREFKILKGQINSPEEFDLETVDGHEINLIFQMGFGMSEELVKCDFQIDILSKSKNTTEASGNFHFIYIYHIDNLKELATVEEDKRVNVNLGLANALASITHSTSRGVLLTRFQGTALQNFILPIVNPNDLLEDKSAQRIHH